MCISVYMYILILYALQLLLNSRRWSIKLQELVSNPFEVYLYNKKNMFKTKLEIQVGWLVSFGLRPTLCIVQYHGVFLILRGIQIVKFTTDIYDITLIGLHREVKCAKRLYNKKIFIWVGGPGPKVGRIWLYSKNVLNLI